MTDGQLLRYSRHILLDAVGIEGQDRLLAAHALVIGAGGLGSPALLYLASAGVGHLTVVDHDTVDLTNLQRQIVHQEDRVGELKAVSAARTLQALNSEIRIDVVSERADASLLDRLVQAADIVLDCSDNYPTRQAVNAACVRWRRPLVSAAAIGLDGQISVWDTREPDQPCYACVFPPADAVDEVRCATMGVLAPLVGMMGSLQALEAIKLLARTGSSLAGRLLMVSGLTLDFDQIRVARDPACPVCGARHTNDARPSP
ncbi:molybdopterin/thiamine biosynthesis adenylyltransferase [Sphaerotilus hippei]|uniref:Molybdopterin-synthase adenylyltransferase n=1 Tax=Sphaerotilus hippei TaxID=744406 RepID=A0A318H7V5_9BURK|nr:molybdopterin-synthase adenylyltransferase MoeB [Sphaerotilus hippei]PXW97922.1 molybdopterin/thiamine biosynthesis adenylyltransferase [Sphaerotilus hippei]